MVLTKPNRPGLSVGLSQPIPAPGCIGRGKLIWGKTTLHPTFAEQEGPRASVRHLVRDYLLPQYNYLDSLRLGWLLRRNQASKWIKCLGWAPFITLVVFVGIVFAGTWLASSVPLGIVIGGEILLSAGMVWAISRAFDPELSLHLLLPRLFGGALVGYLAFALQDNQKLFDALYNSPLGGWLLIGMILLTFALGVGQFTLDAKIRIKDWHTAWRRGLLIGALSVVAILIVGLLLMPINGIHTACTACLLSPTGWLDWIRYVVLTPVVQLIGIITHYIWAGISVTSTLWKPEK